MIRLAETAQGNNSKRGGFGKVNLTPFVEREL